MKKGLYVVTLIGLFLASCAAAPLDVQDASAVESAASGAASAQEGTGPGEDLHAQTLEALSDTDLTEEELAGIIFMREEEKLARDVYLELADLWGMSIFSNIAQSESTHMEAVLSLIEMAGVEDPAAGLGRGEFLDQNLQTMYDDLIARGSESLADALLVGAAIEEIDILDLQENLAATDNAAVAEVYGNLLQGSINHLNSFVQTYQRQTGEEYQPQYLSVDVFQSILDTEASRGGGMGRGRRN